MKEKDIFLDCPLRPPSVSSAQPPYVPLSSAQKLSTQISQRERVHAMDGRNVLCSMFFIPLCAVLLTCLLSRNEWTQDEDRQWTTSTTHRQKTDDEWRSTEAENSLEFLLARKINANLSHFSLAVVWIFYVLQNRAIFTRQATQSATRAWGRKKRSTMTNKRARYIESNILPSQWRRLSSWRIIHDRKNYSFFLENGRNKLLFSWSEMTVFSVSWPESDAPAFPSANITR